MEKDMKFIKNEELMKYVRKYDDFMATTYIKKHKEEK